MEMPQSTWWCEISKQKWRHLRNLWTGKRRLARFYQSIKTSLFYFTLLYKLSHFYISINLLIFIDIYIFHSQIYFTWAAGRERNSASGPELLNVHRNFNLSCAIIVIIIIIVIAIIIIVIIFTNIIITVIIVITRATCGCANILQGTSSSSPFPTPRTCQQN